MKTTLAAVTALALVGASQQPASAGHCGWAAAGAVLSGVVAGAVIARSFEPAPVYYSTPVAYVPAPTVVYAPPPPPPVVFQPAPVVVYQQPVYAVPAPVYVAPPPVVVAPRPFVGVHVGFGPGRCAPVYRRCP